ncbi:TPA: hypothetical protein ACF3R6_003294 [Pseudomonas aeruginosa]|uniref:hypothetical protein n=2 Tax=Pseudomonas aeruginosa TaxID=287 RepID=UPI00053D6E68|nr:hypothetical protein [Pseudomonas aeruginosa]RQJ39806.1 hypothetical protein IPC3_21875 [Pseudomonas aeruginosa]WAJ88545.1 hypothetical protein PAC13_34240 [Pseudomonas aeruginosa]WBJ86578.1 hypothetical protein PALA54_06458 [Pseudomonas aeruginosa]WBJ92855.1 hypothetical protein PALA38_06296 [Pseudomonas aeruginosa]CAI9824211.1 Ammonium-transp domain-containing protein [Pseudomonas aeruginosa]
MATEPRRARRGPMLLLLMVLISLFAVSLTSTAHASLQNPDSAVNKPPTGISSSAIEAAQKMAAEFGALIENVNTIVGIWFAFQACLIWGHMTQGSSRDATFGGFLSHFVAGVLAYHSRAFFAMAHNTIPMIPDFGKLVYDGTLMNALLS